MKFRLSNRRSDALTMIEVLVIMVLLCILFFLFLPAHSDVKLRRRHIACATNLRQIGLAMRDWADAHIGKFPMELSVAEGGTGEIAGLGKVAPHFLALSNELSTPRFLHCPFDQRAVATNFDEMRDINLSYFAGLDARSNTPLVLLAGDRNVTNGQLVSSGILTLNTNQAVGWTENLHQRLGYVLLADGSVQRTTSSSLRVLLRLTELATNRISVP